ncbi:MAG: UGSC family (seleno)protein, partial [Chloroflexota bacterium]
MTLDVAYQVPTIAVHTHIFAAVTRAVARANGTPGMRQAYVPQPVMGKTPAELRAYVDGTDPVTKLPFMREVVDGLTGALSEDDVAGLSFERDSARLCEPGTEEQLRRFFLDQHWTDHLPIVLPTEERVAAMLAGTSHAPTEVVGHLRPTSHREAWEFTVEKVAVNAVLAGAGPEHLPAILALASSGITARGSSSSSFSLMVVANGPMRHQLSMNAGIGAMGPYNLANAVIGRAYGLLSQNLQGGSIPGETYMGSQGNGYSYNNLTFAENEEASPWEPFHVQLGFQPADSVLSIFTGCQATAFTLGLRRGHWQQHICNMLRALDPDFPPTLLLDPLTARQFIEIAGLPSKQAVIDWVYEHARMAAAEYWDYQLVQNYILPRATFGEEPWASMLAAPPDALIRMWRRES